MEFGSRYKVCRLSCKIYKINRDDCLGFPCSKLWNFTNLLLTLYFLTNDHRLFTNYLLAYILAGQTAKITNIFS